MHRVAEDEEREHRITMEVLADAYDPMEQSLGWYYYLKDKIDFPFEARCTEERITSPLEEGERTLVVGMAPETECKAEMVVCVRWMDRELGVPLMQLEPIDAGSATEEAVADWHYWVGRGRRLC